MKTIKYTLIFLFLFIVQKGLTQSSSNSLIISNDFELSLTSSCQICGGFGRTEIIISKKEKNRKVLKIENNGSPKKIRIKKQKFNTLIDSLIDIVNQINFNTFHNYDSIYYTLQPAEQNQYGFPKHLIQIGDGVGYFVTIKNKNQTIKFKVYNPRSEFNQILGTKPKQSNQMLSNALSRFIAILDLLEDKLNIKL